MTSLKPTRRRWVRPAALSGSLLIGCAALLAWPSPARADTTGNQNTYSLSAEGDGEIYEVQSGQLPASTTELVSPYSAQASNDSAGDSTAFAGLPYPGPTLATIGGTVNGLSGGATPPIPPAPGFVTVTYPGSPSADESTGPYVVKATTSQYAASAEAGFGLSPQAESTSSTQQLFSKASVTANSDGSVVATASAGVDGLNIGPIDLLNVSSSETINETGSGNPTVTGATTLGTFSVLGFNVGITPNGFELAGVNLPLPTSTILSQINTALGQQGIQVSVLPASTTTDPNTGATVVTSSSLQVVAVRDVPALGSTTITYDFGRVTVSANDVTVPSAADTGSASGSVTPSSAVSSGSSPDSGGSVVPSASSGAGGSSDVSTGGASTGAGSAGLDAGTSALPSGSSAAPSIAGTGTSTAGSTTPAGGVSAGSGQLPTSLGSLTRAAIIGNSLNGLYLIVALAALVAAGAAMAFRQFGIRLALR